MISFKLRRWGIKSSPLRGIEIGMREGLRACKKAGQKSKIELALDRQTKKKLV